jgi:hypothetical protein
MKSILRSVSLAALLAAAVGLPSARGASLTFTQLFAGGSLTAGPVTFENFDLDTLTITNLAVADFDLTSLYDETYVFDAEAGFNFDGQFNSGTLALGTPDVHTGASSLHLVYSHEVATTHVAEWFNGSFISLGGYDADVSVDAGSYIRVQTDIYDMDNNLLGTSLASIAPGDDPSDPDHVATINFMPSRKRIRVVKTIDILATGDNDRIELEQFTERFTFVPEPSSLGLAGMAVIALRRRKR